MHVDLVFRTDIDECSEGTHSCDINAECINVNGSFNCMCLDGLNGDGFSCFGKLFPGITLSALVCTHSVVQGKIFVGYWCKREAVDHRQIMFFSLLECVHGQL